MYAETELRNTFVGGVTVVDPLERLCGIRFVFGASTLNPHWSRLHRAGADIEKSAASRSLGFTFPWGMTEGCRV